jgi:hypothetical protein
MNMTILPVLLAALAMAPAAAETPAAGEEAAIPFVRSDGIAEWKVIDDRHLYIQAVDGDWYLARTMAPCPRLSGAITLGFETRADQLDRHGTIRVQGWRCPLESVTRSDGPPGS